MKKHIARISLTFALIVSACSATAEAQPSIRIGAEGGLAISSLKYTPEVFAGSTRNGMVIGIVGEVSLNNILAIQISPRYMEKGKSLGTFTITGDAGPEALGTYEAFEKLDYYEVSAIAVAKLPATLISPHAFVGACVGHLASATVNLPSSTTQRSDDQDIKDRFESSDVCIDFGAGVEYQLSPLLGVRIDGRYSLGLTNIWKSDPTSIYESAKSNSIQITLGALVSI